MSMAIVWEAGSSQPQNAENFKVIAEWWKSLVSQKIVWKQRLIGANGQVDWSPQKFDETFVFAETAVRGITFFWKKEGGSGDITPCKLELTPLFQRILLYSEARKDLIVCVEVPFIMENTLKMTNPSWFAETIKNEKGIATGYQLIIRDQDTQTELTVNMDEGSLHYLKHALAQLQ